MKTIKLRVTEGDDEQHEFLIDIHDDGIVDIRGFLQPRCDADRSCPVDIGNEHCPVCLDHPDEVCQTKLQTVVLSVELAQ